MNEKIFAHPQKHHIYFFHFWLLNDLLNLAYIRFNGKTEPRHSRSILAGVVAKAQLLFYFFVTHLYIKDLSKLYLPLGSR